MYTLCMSPSYIYAFLTSAVFTVCVETIVLSLLVLFVYKKYQYGIKDLISAGFFASSMTIPYVWFIFPYITNWSRHDSLLISEPIIAIVEAVFYCLYLKLDMKKSLVISVTCNVVSYTLGPILRMYGFWIFW